MLAASLMAGERARLSVTALPDLPDPIGVAGPFVGVHNDALIVAGGANFPVFAGGDLWEVPKVYYADAWVLVRNGKSFEWKTDFKLKKPVGYGMCVSTDKGVVCIGGQTGETVYSDVFRLEWDAKTKKLNHTKLPPLPSVCTGGAAALIGEVVYVAGGQSGAG
ncbi:MAG: sodium:solute symporter, partial [Limisphaerales bacterium]